MSRTGLGQRRRPGEHQCQEDSYETCEARSPDGLSEVTAKAVEAVSARFGPPVETRMTAYVVSAWIARG